MSPKRRASLADVQAAGQDAAAHHLARCCRFVPILDPRWKWRLRWDMLLMLWIIFNAATVPVDVAIGLPSSTGLIVCNAIADTLFLIDIVVSFRTGIVENNFGNHVLHNEATYIAYNYLRGWFLIDVVSVGVPYNLLSNISDTAAQVGGALGLLKLLRLLRLPRLLSRLVEVPLAFKQLARILMLVIVYVFLNHCLGSLLLWVGQVTNHQNATKCAFAGGSCSWTRAQGIDQSHLGNQYITAFYFAVTTAISVGYGDISASSGIEMLLFSMVMLLTMMFTTILFGSIITIVDKMGAAKRRYDARTSAVEHLISNYNIEEDMALRIREMITYQWDLSKFFDMDKVLGILPSNLQVDVLMDMNKQFLFSVDFFKHQDEAIIREMVKVLTEELVLPGDIICHEGDPAESMYFVRRGSCQVLAPHSYVVVAHMNVGAYFGEIGLLVDHGRTSATIRASADKRCQLAVISRTDLTYLLDTFPAFKASFRKAALARLRQIRNLTLGARFPGQSEHRLVLHIMAGKNLILNHEDVITADVRLVLFGDKREDRIQIGTTHRTERVRGKNNKGLTIFNNVFVLNFHCHHKQPLERMRVMIEFYQCHSWRSRSYTGTVILPVAKVKVDQETKEWSRLKYDKIESDVNVICSACCSAAGGGQILQPGRKLKGQVLLQTRRHRDSAGTSARLRASQGVRELAFGALHQSDANLNLDESLEASMDSKPGERVAHWKILKAALKFKMKASALKKRHKQSKRDAKVKQEMQRKNLSLQSLESKLESMLTASQQLNTQLDSMVTENTS